MATSTELTATLLADVDALRVTIQDAQDKNVGLSTLSNVVELATLRVFSVLETFLQEMFYLCMLNDDSVPTTGAIVPVTSRGEADILLLSSGNRREKFLSWLPIERTLEIAEMYLIDDHPFDRIRYRQTEKRALADLTVVRNAIAHPSEYAYNQFVELATRKSYPTGRAADYLLSTRSGNSEVLLLMTRTKLIAQGLAAPSESEAQQFLEPESEFQANAKAPVGTFECVRCAYSIIKIAPSKLGACPNCEPQVPCRHCGKVSSPVSLWKRLSA